MNTNSFQYHLTFNGKFSNETYIEFFNPNNLDKNSITEDIALSFENSQPEMLKQLKDALSGKNISEEEHNQTIREIRKMFRDNQCKPDDNPCGSKKESENLYFREEYQNAVDIVVEIVNEWLCASDKTDPCQRMRYQWVNMPKNNRILFHGQRGSGKTSVTMSVAKSLEGFGVGPATFKVLPVINPGYFDDDTNILKTIISNMFEMAKCIIKKEDNDNQRNEHETLLKQFEEVYRLLGCIESPNKDKHTLETLNEISKASGMREAMQKLINQFIKILPCKAKYLVLVIDDVDMSVAYAATMLEQINKFLELDNLLILISANLDQLFNEMREHYSKAFEKTLNNDAQSSPSIDVEDLASKYLLKLFPASRRVNVERPVSKLLQTELVFNNENKGNLQKAVLTLIWEKTRLLYIPKDAENTLHPIIPTNLRELAQLLNLLNDMDYVEVGQKKDRQKLFADGKSYDNCKKNINTFKNYFLNIWVPTHLAVDEEQVFINIPSDITEINKHLINSINVIGTRNKRRLMSREVSLDIIERNAEDVNIDRDIYTMVSPNDPRFVKANKISDIFNQPSNYSYGDLLLMIDKYETYFESEENRRFSNAIKIYYSILLFETMFFKSNNVKYDKSEFDAIRVNNEDIIPIQKLIGGTVYYPNYFEIITSKYFTHKGPSFDAKRAFYHKLEAKNRNHIGKIYPLFSVLYYGDIRPDRYETKHIYDTTYDNNADIDGTKFVTFDMLSILSNMLNPWHTITRTDDNTRCSLWKNRINDWESYCYIDKDVTTPNSILPFYSVDVMLLILKEQLGDEDVVRIGTAGGNFSLFKENKRIIDSIRDILYDRNKIIELITKKKLQIIIDYEHVSNNTTYKVDAVIKKEGDETKKFTNKEKVQFSPDYQKKYFRIEIKVTKNNGLSSNITIDDSRDPVFKVGRLSIKNDGAHSFGKVIKNIQKILFPLIECYLISTNMCFEKGEWHIPEKDYMLDKFRDHCIAIVLSEYKGEKKDRDTLIKGLKKHNTISEIYKYLVDQLWENAATEALIRTQIQKGIRNKRTVEYYYKTLLKKIVAKFPFVNNTQIDVYESIFNKACGLFIADCNNN